MEGKHYLRTRLDFETRDIQLEEARQTEYANQTEEYFTQLADVDEDED